MKLQTGLTINVRYVINTGIQPKMCSNRTNLDCNPTTARNNSSKAFIATDDNNSNDWILEGGASSHMTNHFTNVQNSQTYTGNEQITVGNAEKIPITYTGFSNHQLVTFLMYGSLVIIFTIFFLNSTDYFPQVLKLSACKYLRNSSLEALYNEGALPVLRELDLSYSSIGQAAIVDLLAYCRNLVNVNLNGCVFMHELSWGSSGFQSDVMMIGPSLSNSLPLGHGDTSHSNSDHRLEFLNCTGCPYLKKVVIPPAACCFRLTKLNLNLSTNLKEVDLACPNLISLNLSNCSSLEILKLDCPRLTILQLWACSMLSEAAVEAAISGCCRLEILNVHTFTKRLLHRITGI
ncbi:F-box/LRR-repeat protein 15-like [Phalaenopsis equestris]|uniref:F-box/LRR-repeat protein 15-like n=1 Tax=Phalaenopsis equestris TaxID=78828 RepID=UPI0009E307A6|nr:F-box/LRR-repeat protein 15-like [Phalaenopsis equestris]